VAGYVPRQYTQECSPISVAPGSTRSNFIEATNYAEPPLLYSVVQQPKYNHHESDQKFMWFVTAVLKAAANEDRERQRKERLDEDRKK